METKVLQESAEEDEKLHFSQTLSQANPATCERQQGKVLSAKKRTAVRKFLSLTRRKWQESLSFDKLSIFVQKVSRIKVEWLLPLSLIIEDRGQQRINSGTLQMRQEFKFASEVLLLQKSGESDLLDEETLQSDILAGFVRKCHGDDVG